jgi:hypothetical protein
MIGYNKRIRICVELHVDLGGPGFRDSVAFVYCSVHTIVIREMKGERIKKFRSDGAKRSCEISSFNIQT